MSDALVAQLQSLLGASYVLTEPAAVEPYLTDWRGRYRGDARCVARPGSTEQLAATVHACAQAGVAMVPQGGNTGLCGGATPRGGEVLISLTRMNRIRAIDVANNTITVEAGCTLAQVQQTAEADDRLFPLSLAAEGTATIGGNLATNAGGVQVLRYGNARELVLGVEAVLPDGRIWHGLRGLRKDNTGYDLKQLFIGAEGTLGFISAAVLKLFPRPRTVATAWLAVPDPHAAISLLNRLRETLGDCVTAFEIVDGTAGGLVQKHFPQYSDPLGSLPGWRVLAELSTVRDDSLDELLLTVFSAANEAGEVEDAALAKNLIEARAMWALRENISEAQKREGYSIKHDISVPVSRIAEFIERATAQMAVAFPSAQIVCFGHLGDGNLHYNVSLPGSVQDATFPAETMAINRVVHDAVAALGGSISAEHGLGQLKRDEILRYKSSVEMELMRAIKQALDPRGLMNPGKVI